MSEPVGVHRVEKKRLNPWWLVNKIVTALFVSSVAGTVVYIIATGVWAAWVIAHGRHPDDVGLVGVVCMCLSASVVLLGGLALFMEIQHIIGAWLDRLSVLGQDKHVDKE